MRTVLVALLCLMLQACNPSAPSGDAGPPCGSGTFTASLTIEYVDSIDLVVVVDGARVSAGAHDAYVDRMAGGITALLTGDLDADGTPDFRPYRSVRVGVVSADAGDDGEGLSGCAPTGRDGRFVSCGADEWTSLATGSDLGPGLSAVGCAVRMAAATTCVRARPLDAARLALLPAASTAIAGRVPHGDAAHAGFSRRRAALGVVVLAPRDDCSGAPLSGVASSVEVACLDAVGRADLDRAAADLASLRENPALVVATVVGGYPSRADERRALNELAAVAPTVLADGTIAPGCDGPLLSARPAPRLAAFLGALDQLGGAASATSFCSDDRAWIDDFVELEATALAASCLSRAFPRGEGGLVDCALRITLPPTIDRERWASCASLGAPSLGPMPADPDREVCRVPQLPSVADFGAGLSFAYDDGAETVTACGAAYPPGQTLQISIDWRDLDSGSFLELECSFDDVEDAGRPPCE